MKDNDISMPINDFHIHTVYSDGVWTISQVFEHCQRLGIKNIAISDHNVIGGVEYARANDLPQKFNIGMINAVEVNAWHDDYLFEVLFYGFNLDKVSRTKLFTFEHAQHRNRGILSELCDKGSRLGLQFDRDVLFEGNYTGGRLTFYEELEKYKANAGFLSTLPKSMMIRDMTARNPLCIDFKKHYMSLYILHELCDYAGGILSLAHPFNVYNYPDERKFVDEIVHTGFIDAIECYHTAHSSAETQYLVDVCHRHGLLITGGSDSHRPSTAFGSCDHGKSNIPELDFWKVHS